MAALRVLVVDDDLLHRKVMADVVDTLGHHVDLAGNGKEALAALARAPYDLVLMDLHMPVLDGYEAAAEIRRREAGGRRTPIVALTGQAQKSETDRARAAGVDDHLPKPIDFDALAAVLERYAGAAEAEAPSATIAAAVDEAIDWSVIERLRPYQRPGGPDLIGDVIRRFLAVLAERAPLVASALARGDQVAAGDLGHQLKSSAALVGATALARLFAELEASCNAGDAARAAELGPRIESEIARVRRALTTEPPKTCAH